MVPSSLPPPGPPLRNLPWKLVRGMAGAYGMSGIKAGSAARAGQPPAAGGSGPTVSFLKWNSLKANYVIQRQRNMPKRNKKISILM